MHPKQHHLFSSWPPNSVYSFIPGYTLRYTEVRTVLWVHCDLDQLSHPISIGTIHVTPVHKEDENGSTGLYVLPHRRNHIPSFNCHGSHPLLLTSTHLKKVLLSCQLHLRETQINCAVGCPAPYNGRMYLACLGFRFFLIH